jgi:outer membrane protein assembly factor BamA
MSTLVQLSCGLVVAALCCVAPAAPSGPIVSDVVIQGNRLVSTETIKNMLRTQVGKEFVAETLQDDVRNLYATKQFGNVWADKQDDGPGKVRVIVHVSDYSNLIKKVTYQGNKTISTNELEAVTNIRPGMPLNPIANKADCQRIVARYHEAGRPFASCDLLKGADPADTEVVFNITEGPVTRVKDIGFTGNTFVMGAVLKKRVHTSGKFNPATMEDDLRELVKYYRAFGFHDVKVNRELLYSGDGREVSVVFHIQEGLRYRRVQIHYEVEEKEPARVGQIFIEGNERTSQGVILDQVQLYPGQVLSYPDLQKAEQNLARLGLFVTNPDGTVRPTVTVLDNTVDPDSLYKDILIKVKESPAGSAMPGPAPDGF